MKTTSPAMTALEWQRARPLEWLHEKGTAQFQQQTQSFYDSGGGGNGGSTLSFYPGDENSMGLGEVVNQYNMTDLCAGLEYWSQLGEIEVPSLRFGGGIAAAAASSSGYQVTCGSVSRTASCPDAAVEAATDGMLEKAAEKIGAPVGKDSFRKRKLERVQSTKRSEEETRDKKIKGCSDEIGSKITEQSHSNNGGNKEDTKNRSSNKKDTSASTSKDKSKASEVQKTDYIHVRARRGQATDSHSLAERVRREKISARMKFLQGLVPGCSKVTGKAGMLDEIINYVQSLQRQVEVNSAMQQLLSMKLATVNPRLDFNNDNLFSMEMIPACTGSFPVMDMSSDLTSTTYLQLDPMHQVVPSSDLKMGIVNPDAAHQLTTIAPVSVPVPFVNSSCFAMQPTPAWDSGFQNLYSMEFQQGKPTASAHETLQQYTGPIEHTNMKMET